MDTLEPTTKVDTNPPTITEPRQVIWNQMPYRLVIGATNNERLTMHMLFTAELLRMM